MARRASKVRLALNIEKYLHPVAIEDKTIKARAEKDAPADLITQMLEIMQKNGYKDWQIHLVEDEGFSTIKQQKTQYQNSLKLAASEEKFIQEVKKIFPLAEITEAIPKTKDKLDFAGDLANYYVTDNQFDESENEKW